MGASNRLTSRNVAGAAHTFSGLCDFSSNPQEPEAGILLLFGKWTQKSDATSVEATPAFDAKKPHTVIQAISVLITGDGVRPGEMMKGVNLKAIAALIGK